ncbi:MAG: 1-(5-phosphoribosyl)-5-[(5-phosphoribosylamino)methylideneamino]imidazole-4-carboxamide isomerase [Clostridia bacterium]|nr:1-(5-phosphoribosyl)-5-[(5-phosphoribosylamino)methylideneamino]imidazole-4-carboxamide isomerase [Clostridia bacterium]
MLIFPAIDLYGGKAVRLLKGDYKKMTVYSEDPSSVAAAFERDGAECLHIVDLEGARDGGNANLSAVKAIRRSVGMFIELGGGIRDVPTVERYLGLGVDRVILGTAAVEDPAFLDTALSRFGDRIAVGADCLNGFVAVRGWTDVTKTELGAFYDGLSEKGVATVIVTDISKDGAMNGPNAEMYRSLVSRRPSARKDGGVRSADVIASGGVSSMADIGVLEQTGVAGAIVGKALYEGTIEPRELFNR